MTPPCPTQAPERPRRAGAPLPHVQRAGPASQRCGRKPGGGQERPEQARPRPFSNIWGLEQNTRATVSKTGQKNTCKPPSNCDGKEGSTVGCSGGQATHGGWASPRCPPGAGPGDGARDTAGPQAPLLGRWADLWMRSNARLALRAAEGLTSPSGQPRLPVEWGLKSEVGLITCCPLGARGDVTLGTGPRLQQQDSAFRRLQTAGQGSSS